jgi:penicillin G amidase
VTILPPGQSGVVDHPHVFDQLPLFQRLEYKPEPLGGGPGGSAPERARAGVTIRRDGFGVPAISARSEADVWWGAGYAVAQDRLGEMELFRRRGTGRLAEILGKSSLEDDIVARRDFYTPAELRRQFRRVPRRFRQRALAYVAGVNAWIAHVRRTPADLPAEFSTLNVPLRRWDLLDTVRIGVLLARTIPSGDGNELDNLRALRALGPRRFAELLPLSVPGEITTIPRNAGTFPSQPGRTKAEERAAYARSQRWLRRLPLPSAAGARAASVPTGTRRTRSTWRSGACTARSCGRSGGPRTVIPSSSTAHSSATRPRTRSWSSTSGRRGCASTPVRPLAFR